jgi:hypothetical protein
MIALPEDVLISVLSIWLNAKSFLRFDSAFCCTERTNYLSLICNENFVLQNFNKGMINWLLVRSVKLKDLVLVVEFPLSSKKLLCSVRSLKFELFSVNLLRNVVDVINSCCRLTKLNLYLLEGFNSIFLARTDISVLGKLEDLTPRNGCGEEEIILFSNTCHNLTSLDLSLSAKSCSTYAVCELLKSNLLLRYLHLNYDGLDSCVVQLLTESCINLECIRLHCEESVYSLDSCFYRHCVSSTKINFCTLNTVINGKDVLLFSYNVKKKCGGALCRGITIHYREKALKEQMAALLDLLSNFDSVDLRNVVFTEETIKLLLLRNSHLSCLYLLVEYDNFDLKSMLVTFSQYDSLHTVVCKSPQGSTFLSLASFSEQSLDVRTGLDIDECDNFEDDIIFENDIIVENVMPFRSINMNGDMITDEDVLFETLSLLRGFHRIVLRDFSGSLLNHLELLSCNNPEMLTLEMHVECIENTSVFILDLFSFLKTKFLKVFKLSTDEKVYLNYINEFRCSVRGSMKEVIPHTTETVFRQIATLIDPVKDIDNQSFCLTNFDAISMIYCQGMDDNLLMRILLSNPNLSCLECSCRHITESMLHDLTHKYPLIRTLILHDCILEAIGLASLMCDVTHIENFVLNGVHWKTSNDYNTLRTVNSDLKYIRFPKKKEIVQWFDETSHNGFVQRCFNM